ncbi:MAG: hypothetical protein ACTSX6_04775 [Candidatus Heimdallarchaeaceae archaeon]
MASVDNISKWETGVPYEESVRAQLTGSTSTYVTQKFSTIHSVIVTVEGTNSMTYTWSGKTVTITGTNDDWVNIRITGWK